jgi:hypothetical protein
LISNAKVRVFPEQAKCFRHFLGFFPLFPLCLLIVIDV